MTWQDAGKDKFVRVKPNVELPTGGNCYGKLWERTDFALSCLSQRHLAKQH